MSDTKKEPSIIAIRVHRSEHWDSTISDREEDFIIVYIFDENNLIDDQYHMRFVDAFLSPGRSIMGEDKSVSDELMAIISAANPRCDTSITDKISIGWQADFMDGDFLHPWSDGLSYEKILDTAIEWYQAAPIF